MSAAKKIILLLWFIVASLAGASALTPGTTENRVWQKSFAAPETRQAEPLQTAGLHQENASCGYELAPDSLLAAKSVATPFGPAVQATTAEARAALAKVQSSATVYRQGWTETQRTFDAQNWALQNPATTPNFAHQLGMPATATQGEYFWMMGGRVTPGAPVITRPAPGIGGNVGGSMEAVVNPGGVGIDWFHMP